MASYNTTPSGSTRVRFSFEGRPYSITRRTKKAADLAMAKMLADLDRGTHKDERAGRELFEDFSAKVLEAHEAAPNTLQNYRRWNRVHLLPFFGKKPLRSITALDLRLWWARQPKNTNRENAFIVWRMIMNSAVDEGKIQSVPRAKGVGKKTPRRRAYVPVEDFWSIYDLASPDFRAFITVQFWGSMRIGEVLGLDRAQVNLHTGEVNVVQQWTAEPGGAVLKAPKGGRTRPVSLPPVALKEVRAYVKRHPAIGKDMPLFLNSKGRRLGRSSLRREWADIRAKLGIETVHIHDFRATSLTEYMKAGATLPEAMARAGHKDIRSAMVYQHATLARDAENVTRMSQRVAR